MGASDKGDVVVLVQENTSFCHLVLDKGDT
jgi:hypothetical protein